MMLFGNIMEILAIFQCLTMVMGLHCYFFKKKSIFFKDIDGITEEKI